jgi:hypothetical protein
MYSSKYILVQCTCTVRWMFAAHIDSTTTSKATRDRTRIRTHSHPPTFPHPPTRPHLGKQRARRTHVHDIMADHTSYRIHSLRPRPRLRLRSIRASRETWLMQGTESGRVIVAGLPKSTGRGFVDVGMCLVPLLYEYEYVIHSVHCTRIVSWRGGDRGPGRWQVH